MIAGIARAHKWARLERDLRRNPREFGHNQNLWDGKWLSEHLKHHYRASIGVRQCQRMFTQMGFRLRKPRPKMSQSDPGRVAAFKNTPPTEKD